MPPLRRRNPREVIDELIHENRHNEWILYFLIVLYAGLGAWGFVFGVLAKNWTVSVGSVLWSSWFYPAIRRLEAIRERNQRIRLLEIPLSKALTVEESERILVQFLRGFRGIIKERYDVFLGPKYTEIDAARILLEGFRDGSTVSYGNEIPESPTEGPESPESTEFENVFQALRARNKTMKFSAAKEKLDRNMRLKKPSDKSGNVFGKIMDPRKAKDSSKRHS